jgi:hypothetical protein
MADGFEWPPEVIAAQSMMRIAIYQNPIGQIVIRQEAECYADEDVIIRINAESLQGVIKRMLEVSNEIERGE